MQASGRFNCDGRGTLATEYEVEFAVHPSHDPSISNLASRLENGQRVTVLTGAGVSAASGIQTFRGPQGLWRTFRPEQLATPGAFARDAVLVWEWYDWRRQHVAASQPNRAHDILAHWSRIFDHLTLITQNVDGLHGTSRHERRCTVSRVNLGTVLLEWLFGRTGPMAGRLDSPCVPSTNLSELRRYCAAERGLVRRAH